jgi:hypothetical protein
MDTNSKLWRSITGEGSSGRTDLSRRRQAAQYEQHVRNGNDAVRNNPEQR